MAKGLKDASAAVNKLSKAKPGAMFSQSSITQSRWRGGGPLLGLQEWEGSSFGPIMRRVCFCDDFVTLSMT